MEEVVGYPSFYDAGLPCGRCAAVIAGGALKLLNQLFCRTEKLQPNFFAQYLSPILVFFVCVLARITSCFSAFCLRLAKQQIVFGQICYDLCSSCPPSRKEVNMDVNIPLLFPCCFLCKLAVMFLSSRNSIAALLQFCTIVVVLF